jgi:outer membrane protein assembly factor BamB
VSRIGVVLVLLVTIMCTGSLVAAWRFGQSPQRHAAARYLAIADGSSAVSRVTTADGRVIHRSINLDADSAASALAVSQAATFSVIRTLNLASDDAAMLAALLAVPAVHSTIVDDAGDAFTRTETLAILDGDGAFLVRQAFPEFDVVFTPALPVVRVDAAVGVTELVSGVVSFGPSGGELPYTATLTLRERTAYASSLGRFDDCLVVHSTLTIGTIDFGDALRTYCADAGEVAATAHNAAGDEIERSETVLAAGARGIAQAATIESPPAPERMQADSPPARWTYTHTQRTASIFASPHRADGRIFTGNYNGELLALDAATGKKLWRFQSGGPIFGAAAHADGRIVFGSADRRVYALHAASGALLWLHAMPDAVIAAPTIHDGVVYVGDESGRIIALDAADGRTLSTFESRGAIAFPPLAADDALFVSSESGSLFALDLRTLAPRWAFAAPSPLASPPLIAADVIYFSAHDESVYAVARRPRTDRGELLWSTYLRTTAQGALARDADLVLVTSGDRIFALDAETGARRWTTERAVFYGAAVISSGCAVVAADGAVAAYSLHDGRRVAAASTGTSGRLGSLTADDAQLLVGSSAGDVVALPRSALPCDAAGAPSP